MKLFHAHCLWHKQLAVKIPSWLKDLLHSSDHSYCLNVRHYRDLISTVHNLDLKSVSLKLISISKIYLDWLLVEQRKAFEGNPARACVVSHFRFSRLGLAVTANNLR